MEIVLHIGAPKCGSSFLQSALFDAGSALSGAGVFYPRPPHGRNNHAILTVGLVPQEALARHLRFGHLRAELALSRFLFMRRLGAEIAKLKPERVVLSAEELFSLPSREAIKSLQAELMALGPTTIRVVVVVRRPSDWFAASIAQSAKANAQPKIPVAPFFINKIDNWIQVFGRSNVTVMPLAAGALDGSLIDRFLATIGASADLSALIATGDQKRKPTLSAEAVSVMTNFRRSFFQGSDGSLRRSSSRLAKALQAVDVSLGLPPARCKPEIALMIDAGSGDVETLRHAYGIIFDADINAARSYDAGLLANTDCLHINEARRADLIACLAASQWARRTDPMDAILYGVSSRRKQAWLAALKSA